MTHKAVSTLFMAHCSYKYFETYFLRLKPASAQSKAAPELASNTAERD